MLCYVGPFLLGLASTKLHRDKEPPEKPIRSVGDLQASKLLLACVHI